MAKPPATTTLNRDSIPEAPDWINKLLLPLNSALGPTRTALAKGLTHRDNFRCTAHEDVSVTADTAIDVFVSQDFSGPVSRVEVTAREASPPNPANVVNIHPVVSWSATTRDGKSGVRLLGLSGLTAGTKYLLEVLLFAK